MGRLKDGMLQTAAGGSAGFVEVCIMHPLDLIKTRFQIQRGPDDPTRYKSLADCFVKIYKQEGFLSFYKGILPPILAETPKRAVKFATFEQYKGMFMFPSLPLPMTYSLAGFLSGVTEAIIINPFEVPDRIIVLLGSSKSSFASPKRCDFVATATAKEIIAEAGLFRGLYRGFDATFGRHGIWNMIYFGFYHSAKSVWEPPKDPTYNMMYRLLTGFAAGSLASIANIPFDVAKSRIQGPQPIAGQRKYVSCIQTMKLIYREEGYFALYKGLVPKLLRLGPGGAIMLVVFESVYDFLKTVF